MLAKYCRLEAYEFVYFCGNCHLYEKHIEPMKEIFNRTPFEFPTLEIAYINDYQVSDFIISNYQSHDVIKMNMVA